MWYIVCNDKSGVYNIYVDPLPIHHTAYRLYTYVAYPTGYTYILYIARIIYSACSDWLWVSYIRTYPSTLWTALAVLCLASAMDSGHCPVCRAVTETAGQKNDGPLQYEQVLHIRIHIKLRIKSLQCTHPFYPQQLYVIPHSSMRYVFICMLLCSTRAHLCRQIAFFATFPFFEIKLETMQDFRTQHLVSWEEGLQSGVSRVTWMQT